MCVCVRTYVLMHMVMGVSVCTCGGKRRTFVPYDIAICLVALKQGPPEVPKLTVLTEQTGWSMSFCELPVSDLSTRVLDSCGHAQPFYIWDSDAGP